MKKQVSLGKRSGSSVTAPLGCFLQVRPRCPMCHMLACGAHVAEATAPGSHGPESPHKAVFDKVR